MFSEVNMTKALNLLSIPLKEIKERLKASLTYDYDMFFFHGKPHLEYPIIDDNEYLYCVFPEHLHAQLLSGIYYIAKIYDPQNNLSNPFGKSFENYLGTILKKANEYNKFDVLEEIEFNYKGNQLKTSDWIVSSVEEIVFIECKTKRLRIPSKSLEAYSKTLDEDIEFIANALIQLYKVVNHYRSGNIPKLLFDPNKKISVFVITLEEWFIGGPDMKERLDLAIRSKLREVKISLEVLEKFPYQCYSVDNFEIDNQIMFNLGFAEFYKKQKKGEIDETFRKSFPFKNYHETEFKNIFLCL